MGKTWQREHLLNYYIAFVCFLFSTDAKLYSVSRIVLIITGGREGGREGSSAPISAALTFWACCVSPGPTMCGLFVVYIQQWRTLVTNTNNVNLITIAQYDIPQEYYFAFTNRANLQSCLELGYRTQKKWPGWPAKLYEDIYTQGSLAAPKVTYVIHKNYVTAKNC